MYEVVVVVLRSNKNLQLRRGRRTKLEHFDRRRIRFSNPRDQHSLKKGKSTRQI